MKNLRINTITINSSTSITVTFTEKLTPNIKPENITISSETLNTPDSKVLSVSVVNNYIDLTCQPLTPYAAYYLTVKSTSLNPVQSLNGDALLLEDDVANRQLILGPVEPNNAVRDFFKAFLKDNIYNIDDSNTIVSKVIESFVNYLSKALYDTRQVKNENYLKFDVVDEEKVRGDGPFDRLNEESAYEITRVSQARTGNRVNSNLTINNFPFYPVTLQATSQSQTLTIDSVDVEGKFNINELILNVTKFPVTKLNKVVFTLNDYSTYEYQIDKYGYQIQNNTYDQEYGFNYFLLNDKQFKLNAEILKTINFALDSIIKVDADFEYKDLGKIIYDDTLSLTKILTSSREVVPPIVNIFDLKHAPIVDANGDVTTLNGVTFIDTNVITNQKHPAFLYEIPFRLTALPSTPGFYSVDYATGRVYVFGEDAKNTGTGPYPPVATYQYKYTYQSETDYVYDVDTKDLVSLPNGNLRENSVNISLQFEKVLVPGTDYAAEVHLESLSERIENRLLNLGTLRAKNSPVTNVFRIYNETSGEIYAINRWNEDKIYFDYNIAPRIENKNFEKVSFESVLNELLTINNSYVNLDGYKVIEIYLNNNNIISFTEDCIGSSINSSVDFSNKEIFAKEKFYQRLDTIENNYNRLNEIGEYCIDYADGVVYCLVDNTQDSDLGTVSYKKENIVTENKHLISVNDLYYQVSPLNPKNKTFNYLSFGDSNIVPEGLQFSDEQYVGTDSNYLYQLFNQKVGYFDNTQFYNKVTEQIKFIRGVFEYQDLINSTNPINFASTSTFSGNSITVNPISESLTTTVFDGYVGPTQYFYVNLPINIPYLSPNINFNISIIRNSDGKQLWDNNGQIIVGNPLKLVLSGVNSPNLGDSVTVSYQISIADLSRVTVDYNKGDFYVDYTYLADEIVISYEYGDNNIDFRTSQSIDPGVTYYVSYKVGALRDALLKNFGSLLSIDELNAFNTNLNRERYRDALIGAMASAVQGPTVAAMKNLVAAITHIQPELIESAFQSWSLGNSLLYPNSLSVSGEFTLLPGKYNNGVLINQSNQSITLPASSNISLPQGTFETWVVPQWNGIDNDSRLKFKVLKNNQPLSSNLIFIGQSEYHPTLDGYTNGNYDGYYFFVDKKSNVLGSPEKNKNGVFIYYDKDASQLFDRWYVNVIDNNASGDVYTIEIDSDGVFYDTKTISASSNVVLTTRNSKLNIKISNFSYLDETITFISDKEKYLLDVGKSDKNRISIFKDPSGYLNFRVYDKFKNSYSVSADVSGWREGDLHFVSASWKLNTDNSQDEMHLFIDGFEVPNIIKYGQKLLPYPHEKFRTIDPETIIGPSNKDIFGSIDLSTIAGSNTVTSSLTFANYFSGPIVPGINRLYVEDPSFDPNGYVIIGYSGNDLILASSMPLTASNLVFSVNKTDYTLSTEAEVFPNIAVSKIEVITEGSDLVTTSGSPEVTSAGLNFTLVKPGYLIRILDSNFDLTYNILQVDEDNNKLVLEYDMPASLSSLSYYIYSNEEIELPGVRAVRPSYSISTDDNFNSILTVTGSNKNYFVKAKDLLLLRTLGLNHRKVKQSYYVWSNQLENIIPTRLPPPISLNDVKIIRVITPNTSINSSNSTTIFGHFISNLSCDWISNSQSGRTLTAIIAGTNNTDFSSPVTITITGVADTFLTVTETISFTEYGSKDFTNKFITITSATIDCKPFNLNRECLTVKIQEKYPITQTEGSNYVATIRYSYQMDAGTKLSGSGYTVSDGYNFFSSLNVGNVLLVQSPISAAGYYNITGVSEDHQSMTIEPTPASSPMPLPSFTDGVYKVVNTTDYRTGLQNGFFVIQQSILASQPYPLDRGYYDFEYYTYLSVKMDSFSDENIYIGSDINQRNHINAIVDGLKMYSIMLTDTRVGEVIASNQRSVTKDFNSLIPLAADINTLMLINFDTYPFINTANYYKKYIGGNFIQSTVSINDNFGNAVLINNNPIVLDNDGILDTRKQGTIEFWVSPLYDSANDPSERYYFDAYGAKVANVVSINNSSVELNEAAERILSVTLSNSDQQIDYFAGGSLEINNNNCVSEEHLSNNSVTVSVSKEALQVVSVKIVGDLSQTDYFDNGTIAPDKLTIYLGKSLPSNNVDVIVTYKPIINSNNILNNQIIRLNRALPKDNSSVIVKYIPKGFKGDRISIYKDIYGMLKFNIVASESNYTLSTPIYWSRNTWHRVQASYSFNSRNNSDELRLFVDGYERSSMQITGGMNKLFTPGGMEIGYGLSNQTIKFQDTINQLYIGSDYSLQKNAYCIIDNLRISNIIRPTYAPYGEPIDPNYSPNINVVQPVVEDLYTTYLLNFNNLVTKNTDFTFLIAKNGTYYDFTLNIFDSFGIVKGSDTVYQILEKLIKLFKPANSRAFTYYSS